MCPATSSGGTHSLFVSSHPAPRPYESSSKTYHPSACIVHSPFRLSYPHTFSHHSPNSLSFPRSDFLPSLNHLSSFRSHLLHSPIHLSFPCSNTLLILNHLEAQTSCAGLFCARISINFTPKQPIFHFSAPKNVRIKEKCKIFLIFFCLFKNNTYLCTRNKSFHGYGTIFSRLICNFLSLMIKT